MAINIYSNAKSAFINLHVLLLHECTNIKQKLFTAVVC